MSFRRNLTPPLFVPFSGEGRSISQLEAQFHQAMIDIYMSAKRDCIYNATYFLGMVTEHGGLETVRDDVDEIVRAAP